MIGDETDKGLAASARNFITLAKDPKLDEETAFTICQMIDWVGSDLAEDWDWDWLEGKKKNYRKLIKPELLEGAWRLLFAKDWFSLQTTNDEDKKISTIVPLAGLANLRSLVLHNNLIEDLRPLSRLVGLRSLNCGGNRIRDLSPLRNLQALEELALAGNPVSSLLVLEELPRLQKLTLSPDQVPAFVECKRLATVQTLRIEVDGAFPDFVRFPEMPSLKVLRAWHPQSLAGIERFSSLENLHLTSGTFPSLDPLQGLKALTHLSASTSEALSVEPLGGLYALRQLTVIGRKVEGLPSLARLPALHEVGMDDESTCDAAELAALRAGLTAWDAEFKAEAKRAEPALILEVVDQKTFDLYDSKLPFGIRPGEGNEDMLGSERGWLVEEIRAALGTRFEDEKDFHLPYTGGFQRTERVIVFSVEAWESLREVVTTIQRILGETRNEWIIWCQSLLWESPEEQDIPDDAEDFIVWIYPDRIMVAEQHADVVRKLIEWSE